MECREFLQYLDLFAGGDIPGEENREFLLHARECSSCRGKFEKARNILANISLLKFDNMSEVLPETGEEGFWTDLSDEVLNGINRWARIGRSVKERLLWFSMGFGIAAGLLIGIWLLVGKAGTDNENVIPGTVPSIPSVAGQPGPSKLVPVNGPLDDEGLYPGDDIYTPWLKKWRPAKGKTIEMDANAIPVGLRSRL